MTVTNHNTESLFVQSAGAYTELTDCFLFAVVNPGEAHCLNNTQDKLESHLQTLLTYTIIVVSEKSFTNWLHGGHRFANAVLQNAYLLYEREGLELLQPCIINEQAQDDKARETFIRAKIRAEGFLAGAELYRLRMQNGLAAFLLHQAAEQMLRAMLVIRAGLCINTHNIDRLMRYYSMFCSELQGIFNRSREEDKRLLCLLQKAYIEARYNDLSFCVKQEYLQQLMERITQLQEVFLAL